MVVVAWLLVLLARISHAEPPSTAPPTIPPPPTPPSVEPAAATAASAAPGWCGPTANCTVDATTNLGTCKALADDADVHTYACYEWLAKRSCQTARDIDLPKGSRLNPHEQQIVEDEYQANDPGDASCYPPSVLQAGALKTALLVGNPRRGLLGLIWQPVLQLLPTASIGLPVSFTSSDNDARKAIAAGTPVAGAFVRFSPWGLWASVHLFAGTMAPDKTQLSTQTYPNPALVLYGVGVDFLGALDFTWVDANLRTNGLFSDDAASCGFFQLSLDLTGLVLIATGPAQGANQPTPSRQ